MKTVDYVAAKSKIEILHKKARAQYHLAFVQEAHPETWGFAYQMGRVCVYDSLITLDHVLDLWIELKEKKLSHKQQEDVEMNMDIVFAEIGRVHNLELKYGDKLILDSFTMKSLKGEL